MGIALREQGKLEEAIKAFNRALTIKPDYAEAYYNMGIALKEQGKLAEAIDAYHKAISIKPDLNEAGRVTELCCSFNRILCTKGEYTWERNKQ